MAGQYVTRALFTLATLLGLFLSIPQLAAETVENTAQKLKLDLPGIYTEIPEGGFKTNLNIAQQPLHASAFAGIKTQKSYPLGYQKVKADKSMRIRGWEIKERLYLGQARVGDDWGVGMMYTSGKFAYGINDDGVGMTYNSKNAVYRLNSEEISFEIDF